MYINQIVKYFPKTQLWNIHIILVFQNHIFPKSLVPTPFTF